MCTYTQLTLMWLNAQEMVSGKHLPRMEWCSVLIVLCRQIEIEYRITWRSCQMSESRQSCSMTILRYEALALLRSCSMTLLLSEHSCSMTPVERNGLWCRCYQCVSQRVNLRQVRRIPPLTASPLMCAPCISHQPGHTIVMQRAGKEVLKRASLWSNECTDDPCLSG